MRNKNYSKVLIPLIISIALGIGIYLGNNIGSKSQHSPVYEKVSTILSLIETDYVDTVNMEEIIEMSLPDLLLSLDPHSSYLSHIFRFLFPLHPAISTSGKPYFSFKMR